MKQSICMMALACLLLLAPASFCLAASNDPSHDEIISQLTLEQLKDILAEEGYRPTISGKLLVVSVESLKIIYVVSEDLKVVQGAVVFRNPDNKIADLNTKINTWNMNKRFSRATMDTKGNPVIFFDANLFGGVTRANLVEFLRMNGISATSFRNVLAQ